MVDFFETAITFFQYLPTWGWLSAKNIRPSNATQYSLADIQGALTSGFGAVPYVGCSGPRYNATAAGKGSLDNGFTQLSEVWYYYHTYGRPQRGQGLLRERQHQQCQRIELRQGAQRDLVLPARQGLRGVGGPVFFNMESRGFHKGRTPCQGGRRFWK